MIKKKLKGELKRSFFKEEILKPACQIERKKRREKRKLIPISLPFPKIKVIGIGGGGSSIVSQIAEKEIKGNFIVADTDLKTLEKTGKKAIHFQFGQNLTQGLGTGMNPELGERAAESEREKIKEFLKDTDFCILISCLGGGIGSGVSPIFAEISQGLKIITLGIFILPFKFEGEKKAKIAKASLEKLKPNLNASIIIPNERIFQIIDKNTPLTETFSKLNKFFANALEGIIEILYFPGLINIDFADIKTILKGRGELAYLSTFELKKSDYFEEDSKRIFANPLYPYSIEDARAVLFNIVGGENLSLDEVEKISNTISSVVNPRAKITFGVIQNKNYQDKIKITLLATGCKWEEWEKREEKFKAKPKKKIKKKPPELPKIRQPELTQTPELIQTPIEKPGGVKIVVRRNAFEVQKTIEEEEKKLLAKERKWETPAFLRHKSSQIEEKPEE